MILIITKNHSATEPFFDVNFNSYGIPTGYFIKAQTIDIGTATVNDVELKEIPQHVNVNQETEGIIRVDSHKVYYFYLADAQRNLLPKDKYIIMLNNGNEQQEKSIIFFGVKQKINIKNIKSTEKETIQITSTCDVNSHYLFYTLENFKLPYYFPCNLKNNTSVQIKIERDDDGRPKINWHVADCCADALQITFERETEYGYSTLPKLRL